MSIDAGALNKLILIQRQDPDTEQWGSVAALHARVNKSSGGQSYDAGADQHHYILDFDVRYGPSTKALVYGPHLYRIVYAGHTYKVVDTDDYQERHQYIRIKGELYAGNA